MLDGGITLLQVGVLLLVHTVTSHLCGLEEVHEEVHALVAKLDLSIGDKAFVAGGLQVDQTSHHVAGNARSEWLNLSAKEPSRVGLELILGQLGGVLAQDVDIGSQVNMRQADGVDGERSSCHLASADGRNPKDGQRILLGLLG